MIERKPLLPTTNYEDKWFSSNSKDSILLERPKDVKWVVIAQIIGFIFFPAIYIPFFTSYIPNVSVILYGIIALIVLALTSVGLIKGETWSLLVTRIFQLVFMISWLTALLIFFAFGVFGAFFGLYIILLIPMVIFRSINKSDFKKFYKDKKPSFSKRLMTFLLFGTIFIIVFNIFPLSLFALEMNENQWDFGNNINLDQKAAKEELLGTWKNDNETIKLQFYKNGKCKLYINNGEYSGEWSFLNSLESNEIKISVWKNDGSNFYSDNWISINYEKMKMEIKNPFSNSGNDIILKKPIEESHIPVFEILVGIIAVIGIITIVLSYKKIKKVIINP